VPVATPAPAGGTSRSAAARRPRRA
jgi:hypothetical protein